MTGYVFVGSEAQGYYSNSYVCEGVFLSEDYYDKHEDEIDSAFTNRTFHELDGKHSEVYGDFVIKSFDNVADLVRFASNDDVCYEVYHLSEQVEDHEGHAEKIYSEIEGLINGYKAYTYVLTPEQNAQVKSFIEELTYEGKSII